MSSIVPESIVVLVHRRGICLTARTHNWSDQFNYIACNAVHAILINVKIPDVCGYLHKVSCNKQRTILVE